MNGARLRVILLKPSKYGVDGFVERFRRGFVPNSTLTHLASLTPAQIDGAFCEKTTIDEYVQTDLEYLHLLQGVPGSRTLFALVGVQSHQFQRALDLTAYAKERGVECCVIGGPHAITCDTSELQGRGVSFAMSEAETVWPSILRDALSGELLPVYGADAPWQETLDPPVVVPPAKRDLRRYVVPILGLYPARGCPFNCNFCSVIQIAGRRIRSQPVATTLASLRAAKAAGVRFVLFTSDNFNKYPEAVELLQAMIEENIRIPLFVQCDAQVGRQPEFIELLARAGCFQMFVGVESFSRETLKHARKLHNRPEQYSEIIALCRAAGITTHFSNIIGFPEDTDESVREHLETLRSLSPEMASFYLLTPIPGTEQYTDFLNRGLITEENLDRFDGTQVTWEHPNLSAADLRRLLAHCYREFNRPAKVVSKLLHQTRHRWDYRTPGSLFATAAYSILSRLAARRGDHPMAGGVSRALIDRAADYREIRHRVFGIERAALPRSILAADSLSKIG